MFDIVSKAHEWLSTKLKRQWTFLKKSEHKMQLADLLNALAESKLTIISLQQDDLIVLEKPPYPVK